jgi:glycosyltransferase involved in cell wall biosynthesis
MRKYDLLHFHSYTIIGANVAPRRLPQGLDLPLWKAANKKIIKHHHGSDIRYHGCPYFQRRYADVRLASTPDLLEWDPDAELVLNPIVAENYEYVGVKSRAPGEPITVVHAPTDRKKKATEQVIQAIEEVKRRGINVELRIVENTPNEEAIEIYKQSDIIADRFKLGWYGVFSIEAMALGKPVLVYIDDDYKQYAPDLPVVDTSIDEIADHIAMLAEDYEYRRELGKKGREFVEKHHDAEATAERILSMVTDTRT